MDPVDGYDPYGVIKEFITNPPKQLPFLMPTLIITTGLDSIPRGPGFPACAPANFSNLRFYASLSGPTWLLNFTSYGHADVLDDFVSLFKHVCVDFCYSADNMVIENQKKGGQFMCNVF